LSFAAAASAAAGTASTATGSSATSAASSSTSLAIGSGAESDTASDSGAVSDANADDRCGQGFCLLNNAAIAAKHALLRYPEIVRRVAIIDVDLHHGNGTEEIVRKRLPRRGPL
jgi:acetoin utilization deacetylase AcuC-like enzyme